MTGIIAVAAVALCVIGVQAWVFYRVFREIMGMYRQQIGVPPIEPKKTSRVISPYKKKNHNDGGDQT